MSTHVVRYGKYWNVTRVIQNYGDLEREHIDVYIDEVGVFDILKCRGCPYAEWRDYGSVDTYGRAYKCVHVLTKCYSPSCRNYAR